MIKGFKAFNKDLICREFQYEVGEEYEHDGNVEICESGFHFCENPLDVFNYYPIIDSRYCEVFGDGTVKPNSNDDTKIACSKIKIGAEISLKN